MHAPCYREDGPTGHLVTPLAPSSSGVQTPLIDPAEQAAESGKRLTHWSRERKRGRGNPSARSSCGAAFQGLKSTGCSHQFPVLGTRQPTQQHLFLDILLRFRAPPRTAASDRCEQRLRHVQESGRASSPRKAAFRFLNETVYRGHVPAACRAR